MALNFFIPARIKADNVPFLISKQKKGVDEQLKSATAAAESKSVKISNDIKDLEQELELCDKEIKEAESKGCDSKSSVSKSLFKAQLKSKKQYKKCLETAIAEAKRRSKEADNATTAARSEEDKAHTQVFSFRTVNGPGQLHICPPFMCADNVGSMFNNDVGNKALYGYAKSSFDSESTVTFANLMLAIPAVHVREYQVDYTIDLIANLMQKFAEGIAAANNAATSEGMTLEAVAAKLKRVAQEMPNKLRGVWNQILEGGFWQTLANVIQGLGPEPNRNGMGSVTNPANLLYLPFIFYYKLMAYTTTSHYILPFSGKVLYSTKGSSGWDHNQRFGIAAMLPSDGEGAIGKLLSLGKNFLKHIQIHKSPLFNPNNTDDTGSVYEIEFSLFNSNMNAAINNYIFILNLIPNNMWVQFGVVMLSSCLYDIKIDGGIRCMCCTCDMTVGYKGVLRSVPQAFIDAISTYLNHFEAKSAGNAQDLIKIPDVYEVKLSFTSLLPNNFNNYLYGFCNPNIGDGHTDNVYTQVLDKASAEVKKLIGG